MLPPILVDDVRPRTPSGLAAKGVIGQELPVSAVLVADGHDRLGAQIRWRKAGARTWYPLTRLRRWRAGRHMPCGGESAEMIEADDVNVRQEGDRSVDPPPVAGRA